MQAQSYTFGALRKAMTLFRTASKLSPGKRNPGTLHRIGPIPSDDLQAELEVGAPQPGRAGPALRPPGPEAALLQLAAGTPLSPRAEGPPASVNPVYSIRTEGKSLLLQNWTDKVHAGRESKKHAATRKEERRKFECMNLKDLYKSLPNNSNLKRSIAALRLSHAAQMLRVVRERRAAQAQHLQERGKPQRTELAWPPAVGPSRDVGGGGRDLSPRGPCSSPCQAPPSAAAVASRQQSQANTSPSPTTSRGGTRRPASGSPTSPGPRRPSTSATRPAPSSRSWRPL